MKQYARGFTIVELLIVIIVIGILASISVVTYRGSQERAQYAKAQTDLKNINDALTVYKAQNGRYPDSYSATGNFFGWVYSYDRSNSNPSNWTTNTSFMNFGSPSFIPGYLDSAPRVTPVSGGKRVNYGYRSDGDDYLLIRFTDDKPLPSVELSQPIITTEAALNSPARFTVEGNDTTFAWGYRSLGAATKWP
jgi:prepilin-type N-terminal cleavage/methylation domain-containing protein